MGAERRVPTGELMQWVLLLGTLLAAGQDPVLWTEAVELVDVPLAEEGRHEYMVTLPERLRGRHFSFIADRSVCRGPIIVNGAALGGDDAGEVFRFDRGNHVSLNGCIERTPRPLQLESHPKVYVASARARYDEPRKLLIVDVSVRNTLLNSVSATLTVANHDEDWFIGPETSQSRSISVRLKKRPGDVLEIDLYKFSEAIEGAYHHIRSVAVSRI